MNRPILYACVTRRAAANQLTQTIEPMPVATVRSSIQRLAVWCNTAVTATSSSYVHEPLNPIGLRGLPSPRRGADARRSSVTRRRRPLISCSADVHVYSWGWALACALRSALMRSIVAADAANEMNALCSRLLWASVQLYTECSYSDHYYLTESLGLPLLLSERRTGW